MRFTTGFSCAALLCLLSGEGHAAGFYIQEQSVRAQGSAFAGAGAYAADAAGLFFNPANLTQLEGPSATLGASLIMPRVRYRDRGSTAGPFGGGQAAFAGVNGGNPFSATPLPSFYAAVPMDGAGRFWAGVGAGAPFGLANDYGRAWFGRYDSTKSALSVYNISPVVAFRVNEFLSVGGGPDFQFSKATLESALPCPDAGLGCGAAFSPASDGLSQLKGTGRTVGFNAGATARLKNMTTGVHYRAATAAVLKGTAGVSGLGGGLAPFNGARAATAKLKLPDILSFSAAYDATPRLKILGSYNLHGWDNFDEIRVKFAGGAAPDNVTAENYRDTSSIALGAEWRQSDRLSFRAGTQYDRTPTTAPDRSTRTPDSDRLWLSAGLSYGFAGGSVDAAVSHVFMRDARLSPSKRIYAGTAADTTVQVDGVADNSLDIVSVQGVWKF